MTDKSEALEVLRIDHARATERLDALKEERVEKYRAAAETAATENAQRAEVERLEAAIAVLEGKPNVEVYYCDDDGRRVRVAS